MVNNYGALKIRKRQGQSNVPERNDTESNTNDCTGMRDEWGSQGYGDGHLAVRWNNLELTGAVEIIDVQPVNAAI